MARVTVHRGLEIDFIRRRPPPRSSRTPCRAAPSAARFVLGVLGLHAQAGARPRPDTEDELALPVGASVRRQPRGRVEDDVTSVTVTGSDFPARMKNGTPDQRQLSISSLSAGRTSPSVRARRRRRPGSRRTARARSERIRLGHCHEDVALAAVDDVDATSRRRLHCDAADDLEEVVLHDVAHRAPRGRSCRGRRRRSPRPSTWTDERSVGSSEPQVEDVLHGQLPEEVVDPVQLRLVDVCVELAVQRPGRREVVPEGLRR